MSETSPYQTLLIDFYTQLYRREKSDSPNKSQIQLMRQVANYLKNKISKVTILDIGAGRQILERLFFTST